MSHKVEAKCACGCSTAVSTGCGIEGPVPDCFPALCRRCKEVVAADITSCRRRVAAAAIGYSFSIGRAAVDCGFAGSAG